MRRYAFLFIFLILVTIASALPFSQLGDLRSPHAYVMPDKMIIGSITNYMTSNNNDNKYGYVYGFSLSGNVLDRLDLGIVYAKEDLVMGNFKLKITDEALNMPAISIGMDNVFSKIEADDDLEMMSKYPDVQDPGQYDKNSFFVVASKASVIRGLPFASYLETIISFGWGNNRFVGTTKMAKRFNGLFGSVEASPVPNLYFIGEVDGFDINFGAKYTWKNFNAKAIVKGIDNSTEYNKVRLGLNVGYAFDKFVSTKQTDPFSAFKVDKSKEIAGRRTITTVTDSPKQSNELLEELKLIRAKREQAEKELEDIKKILQEQQ